MRRSRPNLWESLDAFILLLKCLIGYPLNNSLAEDGLIKACSTRRQWRGGYVKRCDLFRNNIAVVYGAAFGRIASQRTLVCPQLRRTRRRLHRWDGANVCVGRFFFILCLRRGFAYNRRNCVAGSSREKRNSCSFMHMTVRGAGPFSPNTFSTLCFYSLPTEDTSRRNCLKEYLVEN